VPSHLVPGDDQREPITLRCLSCHGTEARITATRCGRCGFSLEVSGPAAGPLVTPEAEGVWRYAALLPGVAPASRVSLGEGGTPLLAAPRLGAELGVRLLVKDETRNPTGSFKDRILAVAASAAVQCDAAGLICASTGNAGVATAAYAARAGIPAVIVAPARTPPAKVTPAMAYGARWVAIEGDYSDAHALAADAAEHLGYLNTTTTFVSPFSVAGSTSLAYELHERFDGGVPDWVVVPIGAGPLLAGIERAYRDLRALGLAARSPRLLAVQPTGCAPVARAFRDGAAHVSGWGTPETVVGGLADPLNGYEHEGDLTLAALRRSGGAAVMVDDEDTLAWVRRLAEGAGVFAEPSGAIAVAAVEQARREGLISAGSTVVSCVTGSGLKDLGAVRAAAPRPRISPDVAELQAFLKEPA
jgi:threonine synthase